MLRNWHLEEDTVHGICDCLRSQCAGLRISRFAGSELRGLRGLQGGHRHSHCRRGGPRQTRREHTKIDLASHMLHEKMRAQGLESRGLINTPHFL